MPIYEYQCSECEHELEALQKMSDDPLVECPECHKMALTKKISAAAFRLSGSGWYETDFKSGKKKNLAGDSASNSSENSKPKAETKTKTSDNKTANAKTSKASKAN